MKILRTIVFLLFAAMMNIALGDGGTSLIGVTTDGYTVAVDCEKGPCSVEIWKKNKDRKIMEQSVKDFHNEPCVESTVIDKSGQETYPFTCTSDAKSPIAGTTYIGKRFNGSCVNGDPEYLYKCIAGCGKNSTAPRELKRGYWEC